MDLKTFIQNKRGRASEMAAALGISRSYLSQMASRSAPIPPKLAVAIETQSEQVVTRKDLFPDDWQQIWPELQ